MVFNTSKTDDNRFPARIKSFTRWASGYIDGRNDKFVPKRVGFFASARFNRTKNFHKGKFSVNPFEGVTWACTTKSPKSETVLTFPTGSRNVVVSGDLAAYVRTYASVGFGYGQTFSAEYPSANEVNRALVQAYAKLAKADFDLGVFAGELGETLSMLKSPLKGFRAIWNDFIRSSRAISKRRSVKLIDAMASQWLEYRYGIMPLVSDIQSLINIVNDGLTHKTGEILRYVRKPPPTTTVVGNRSYSFSDMLPNTTLQFSERLEKDVAFSSRVFYRWDAKEFETLRDLGLSPSNIANTAWELTRLSYVVDWWFSVGDWLSSLFTPLGSTILGNSVSYIITYRSFIQGTVGYYAYPGDPRFPPCDLSKFSSVEQLTYFTRQVNLPTPALPPVNLDFSSWNHVVDSLSLIWTSTKRPKQSR